jgi:hypothetical protein
MDPNKGLVTNSFDLIISESSTGMNLIRLERSPEPEPEP